MGVQGILENVPDRDPNDPPPLPITKEGKKDKKRDPKKLSGEVCAVLRLDNQEVGNTGWKVASQQCWDARFRFFFFRLYIKFIFINFIFLKNLEASFVGHFLFKN